MLNVLMHNVSCKYYGSGFSLYISLGFNVCMGQPLTDVHKYISKADDDDDDEEWFSNSSCPGPDPGPRL